MSVKRRRRSAAAAIAEVTIDSMSHEGRGVARIDGKTVFVFGALAGERVRIKIIKSKRNFAQATTLEVLEASALRIEPRCAAFRICGGCSLQHLSNDGQLDLKQSALLEMLAHAGIAAEHLIPALRASSWGYRNKARLGVKHVPAKGRVLVGFRERNSAFIADIKRCEVLLPKLGQNLEQLSGMIGELEARAHIPQIEVAADADKLQLVFRHLRPLSAVDRQILSDYGEQNGFYIQLQPGGPTTVENLWPTKQRLSYDPLGNGDLKIAFGALDFTQVNASINQQMVAQALDYLDLQATDRVLDLFCGLGNFTLPMARRCHTVTGVEVDATMVAQARASAAANGIDNSDYFQVDLTQIDLHQGWMQGRYDKILLDPPRCGAREMVTCIGRLAAARIVYVSCQPASLVRDAAIICDQGYRLVHIGIMDMFPQTAHVESMAVFELKTAV